MSDRTVQIVRLVVGVLALAGSILAQLVDAPDWVSVLAGTLAAALALVTRLEVIVGADLDGDGRVGPRGVGRRPPILPALLCAGLGLQCGGATQAVDVGEPVAYLGATGYAAVTAHGGEVTGEVDGEIQADASVPVCVALGDSSACVTVRIYALAMGVVGESPNGEICAEVRAWGQAIVTRCVGAIVPPLDGGSSEVAQ